MPYDIAMKRFKVLLYCAEFLTKNLSNFKCIGNCPETLV